MCDRPTINAGLIRAESSIWSLQVQALEQVRLASRFLRDRRHRFQSPARGHGFDHFFDERSCRHQPLTRSSFDFFFDFRLEGDRDFAADHARILTSRENGTDGGIPSPMPFACQSS